MAIAEVAIPDKLCRFIGQYAEDHYCLLELLRFLGRHPSTRFSQQAIAYALNSGRLHVETALKYLVNRGAVRRNVENNAPFYSLTDDESLRGLVLDLAKLDWSQWQLVLRRSYPAATE